jgi:hypothetical protein
MRTMKVCILIAVLMKIVGIFKNPILDGASGREKEKREGESSQGKWTDTGREWIQEWFNI